MSNLFCCTTIQPTNHPNPEHEQTFTDFTKWALTIIGNLTGSADPAEASVCIQLVRQINSGPIESIRYFVGSDKHGNFEEVAEDGSPDANFVKMNECKTFRCSQHDRIFDLNLYEPSTGSTRHWRSRIAKPLKQIENALKNKLSGSRSSMRPMLGSMGSRGGQRTGASYGYGSGMGYGSGWGSHLGAGCGRNWGTGTGGATVFVPGSTTTTTTVVTGTGCNDCDGGINRKQDHEHSHDQDQDQEHEHEHEHDQNQGQDPEIYLSETEHTDKDNGDQPVPSSPALSTEVAQDDAGSYSPHFETQATFHDDGTSQSYLHTEDYGSYYPGVSSDDYGSYDCGGGNNDVYDYGDCGGFDD
ncbi:hypothetical protein N7447_002979 [Penicillium robsamsonii]|uniref:uncharacterized protein n=1 Tax=Penicillium robsamsonii TaxID=1792511 RepID=UPI0025476CC0|nr:uncharacterized protein N7447_002979 [Penicillium robsamsonii]KAJ5836953.1 hypothetical protein N7447_002979 [Penicillium robsamsonii]